jgi:hypothetical protein
MDLEITPAIDRDLRILLNEDLDRFARTKALHRIEDSLLEQNSCSKQNVTEYNFFRKFIGYVNFNKLQNIDLFDEQRHVECLMEAALTGPIPSSEARVHEWFHSVKQIGSESVEGIVLATGNNFVIKTTLPETRDKLIHEAAIGLIFIPEISKDVPNFMQVYDYFTCSPAAVESKYVLTWCDSSRENRTYLVMQNIVNSISLNDFIKKEYNSRVLNLIILQIVNALHMASKFSLHTLIYILAMFYCKT